MQLKFSLSSTNYEKCTFVNFICIFGCVSTSSNSEVAL